MVDVISTTKLANRSGRFKRRLRKCKAIGLVMY